MRGTAFCKFLTQARADPSARDRLLEYLKKPPASDSKDDLALRSREFLDFLRVIPEGDTRLDALDGLQKLLRASSTSGLSILDRLAAVGSKELVLQILSLDLPPAEVGDTCDNLVEFCESLEPWSEETDSKLLLWIFRTPWLPPSVVRDVRRSHQEESTHDVRVHIAELLRNVHEERKNVTTARLLKTLPEEDLKNVVECLGAESLLERFRAAHLVEEGEVVGPAASRGLVELLEDVLVSRDLFCTPLVCTLERNLETTRSGAMDADTGRNRSPRQQETRRRRVALPHPEVDAERAMLSSVLFYMKHQKLADRPERIELKRRFYANRDRQRLPNVVSALISFDQQIRDATTDIEREECKNAFFRGI